MFTFFPTRDLRLLFSSHTLPDRFYTTAKFQLTVNPEPITEYQFASIFGKINFRNLETSIGQRNNVFQR